MVSRRHAIRGVLGIRAHRRLGGNQHQLAHDPAHAVYRGDSTHVGPGSPAAAMACSHRTGGPAAVECSFALGALSGGAGHAAWGDYLDLAHPQSLSTRAGQTLVACLRSRLLPVHRLAVLVV